MRNGVLPVYVSVGNVGDLCGDMGWVLACCAKYRLPVIACEADEAANRLRRAKIQNRRCFGSLAIAPVLNECYLSRIENIRAETQK